MTTMWQAAPAGSDWRQVDGIVGLVEDLVATEARPGGVHQVRWDPNRSTRVAFERPDGEVAVVEVGTDGMTRSSLVDDPALPGLRTVLDAAACAERFAMLLDGRLRRCRAEVVSYRPGSRCVVRCTVQDGAGSRTYYVKVLAHGFEEYVEAHETLAAALGDGLPALLGCWPDLRAVVTEQASGRTLSAVLGAEDDLPLARTALAVSLGGLLARVHGAPAGPLVGRRTATVEAELAELAGYLPVAWHADPAFGLSMSWALESLRQAPPASTPVVLSHGSFRSGQVLVEDTRLALLDLDSACLGAPERDLGNALAYLDWQRLRRNPQAAAELPEAFLTGYLDRGGRMDRDALSWWHAAALLKIAGRRYRSLDTGTWAAVPRLVSLATTLLELRRSGGGAPEVPLTPVPEVTDPARMSALLRGVLPGRPTEVDLSSAAILRLAPGRRVVVRYELDGPDSAPSSVIAKAYAEPSRALIAHDNLSIFATLAPDGTGVRTQPPLGVLPDRGIVVCGAAPGVPLTELDPEIAAEPARRAGRWLRGVHRVRSGPSRLLDLDREVVNLRHWAAEVGRAHLRLAAPARALADELAVVASHLPTADARLIHKDLHLGHVIVDRDGTTSVIDLDEARLGDPLLDVAHLCAYADDAGDALSRDAKEAFLAGYGPLPGPEADRRFTFFYAYTLLKITKQDARDTLADEAVRAALRRLSRGLSCLAG